MRPQLAVQLQIWLPDLPSPEEILFFLPVYLVLGVGIGILAVAFNRGMLGCLDVADRLSKRTMFLVVTATGALAGALTLLAPEMVGGGEGLVKELFSKSPTLGFLLILLGVRTMMTFLSYSVGVPGGIFAPMLALGTLVGLGFGDMVQNIFPSAAVHSGSFAIAAMGALFAATARAPLTGIVLVAEMTGSFEMLPALIVTCMAASIASESLGNKPIYDLLLDRTLRNAKH